MQCSLAAIIIVSGCAAVLGSASGEGDSTAAIALYFMLPLAAYCGFAAAAMRWRRIGDAVRCGVGVISSPYVVELRVRWLLEQARDAVRYNTSKGHGGMSDAETPLEMGRLAPGDEGAGDNEAKRLAYSERAFKKKRAGANGEGDDGIDQEEFLRHSSVVAADEIMRNACITFSSSPIMRLFASHYHGSVKSNIHLERLNLLLARAAADSSQIDVRFWCHSAMLRLSSDNEVTSATSVNKMTVFKRMRFEQLQSQTRQQVLKGHQFISQFWSQVSEKNPDLPKVQSLGRRIINLINDTEEMYKEVSALRRPTRRAIRLYVVFYRVRCLQRPTALRRWRRTLEPGGCLTRPRCSSAAPSHSCPRVPSLALHAAD